MSPPLVIFHKTITSPAPLEGLALWPELTSVGHELRRVEGARPFPSALATSSPDASAPRIQIKDVVTMAMMVPVGIDFWASLRSPDRFEPAMIPTEADVLTCKPGNTAAAGQGPSEAASAHRACWPGPHRAMLERCDEKR